MLHGNHGEASHQLRMSDNLIGGIEDLHIQENLGHDIMLRIDGRAFAGNDDYLAKVEVAKEDVGYIRAGYSQYRTWYDGNGGFFPFPTAPGGLFFPPQKEVFALDRSCVFFEFGLRNPNLPEVTFRYERDTRHGQKDSTVWGDTSLTGVGSRKITPAFRDINEVRDIFSLDVAHTLANTDFNVGVRFEHENNDNSLNLLLNPTEIYQTTITQHDSLKDDMFSAHGMTETHFGEKVWFTLGYAYTAFNTDLGGSRVYGPGYDTTFDPARTPYLADGEGFYKLLGGSEWDQHVAHINLMWKPTAHLSLIAAGRFESQRNDNTASFVDTLSQGSNYMLTPYQDNSSNDTNKVAESLELRYTGLPNWLFYARGEWTQEIGSVIDRVSVLPSNTPKFSADIDRDRHIQKYDFGTNWYPCQKATVSAEYFHKVDDNRYSNSMIPPGPAAMVAPLVEFPGRLSNQDFNSDNLNFRLTLRPLSGVALVSQYEFMRAEIDTQTFGIDMRESGKTTNHNFSEAITWSPLSRLYLQASASYVLSKTETPAAITIQNPLPNPSRPLIGPQNFDFKNNYWTLSASAGFVIDSKTNLQAEYTYYKADNFTNVALFTQPYGAGAEEHMVTLNLTRQLMKNVTANIKCGYQEYNDQTSGGYNNFSGFLVFSGLQVRF